MTESDPAQGVEPIKGNKAVEAAAVLWVMELERNAGRSPVDRRNSPGFPGDLESHPRIIEIKASSGSYRGWFLPLEPIQLEHARTNDDFYIYVVDNIGQGDPTKFQLRILHGEQLRRLVAKAVTRTYHEMPWPTAEYDAAPGIEALA